MIKKLRMVLALVLAFPVAVLEALELQACKWKMGKPKMVQWSYFHSSHSKMVLQAYKFIQQNGLFSMGELKVLHKYFT
jgi:hypothetical protein